MIKVMYDNGTVKIKNENNIQEIKNINDLEILIKKTKKQIEESQDEMILKENVFFLDILKSAREKMLDSQFF